MGKALGWALGVAVALLAALLLIGANHEPSPEERSKYIKEAALKDCLKQLNEPLQSQQSKDFIRGACLRLRNDLDGKSQLNANVESPLVDPKLTPAQKQRLNCANSIDELRATYDSHLQRGDHKAAADAMRKCSKLLEDPFLQNLVSEAEALAKRSRR